MPEAPGPPGLVSTDPMRLVWLVAGLRIMAIWMVLELGFE